MTDKTKEFHSLSTAKVQGWDQGDHVGVFLDKHISKSFYWPISQQLYSPDMEKLFESQANCPKIEQVGPGQEQIEGASVWTTKGR